MVNTSPSSQHALRRKDPRQTFGDFRGRRTTEERLCRNNIIPTLKDAVPGDLSLVLPHRIMVDIKEMLKALDKGNSGYRQR